MKAPERIYLQYEGDLDKASIFVATCFNERFNDGDVEYVRADVCSDRLRALRDARDAVLAHADTLAELRRYQKENDVRHAAKLIDRLIEGELQ